MSAKIVDYAALVMKRQTSRWVREHLILPFYNLKNKGRIMYKYPGGMSEGNESSPETAVREFKQETDILIDVGNLRLLEFYTSVSRYDKSEIHTKGFFESDWTLCKGRLRKEKIPDGNEILLPPVWINVNILYGMLIKTHQAPFLLAVQRDLDNMPPLLNASEAPQQFVAGPLFFLSSFW